MISLRNRKSVRSKEKKTKYSKEERVTRYDTSERIGSLVGFSLQIGKTSQREVDPIFFVFAAEWWVPPLCYVSCLDCCQVVTCRRF